MPYRLNLSDEQVARLQELQHSAELPSITAVLSHAVTLFEIALREIGQGREMASIDAQAEVYRAIKLPSFDTVSRHRG